MFANSTNLKNQNLKAKILLGRLDESCLNQVTKLLDPDLDGCSFEGVIDIMKKLYDEREVSEARYKSLFVARVQSNGESLQQYFVDVKDLASKAFPGVPKKKMDEYIKAQFIQGIDSKEIKHKLLFAQDKNLEQTCKIAEDIHNTLYGDKQVVAVRSQIKSEPVKQQAYQGNTGRAYGNDYSRATSNEKQKGCWICGDHSHRRYDCPKNPDSARSTTSKLASAPANTSHVVGQMNAMTMDAKALDTLKDISGFLQNKRPPGEFLARHWLLSHRDRQESANRS